MKIICEHCGKVMDYIKENVRLMDIGGNEVAEYTPCSHCGLTTEAHLKVKEGKYGTNKRS